MANDPEELLTVREVSERLKLTPNTILRKLRSGEIKGQKLPNRTWRIKQKDLEEYITSSK